jgi:DNA primase catalytic core
LIAPAELERIKREADLVALIRSRGVELRRRGNSFKGFCPFHSDDRTPSLSVRPDKNLWRCFGCGAGGDAIRFVQLHDKLTFPQAASALGAHASANGAHAPKSAVKEKSGPPSAVPAPSHSKLLEHVVSFYHRSFLDDPRGAAYLCEQRCIRNSTLFEAFRLGLATGKLRQTLPAEGELLDGLHALGVLTERNTELLHGCIVFPLHDAHGEIVSLYGRRILEGETRHLYLPGPRRGLFNRHAAKTAKELILVEGILDALALIDCGYTNTLPIDGTEGLREEHLELLRAEQVREVYVMLDGDEAGRAAAEKVATRLRQERMRVVVVALPTDKDPADVVPEGGSRAIEALLRASDPQVAERPSMPFHSSRHGYARTPEGFRVTFAERVYELRGITRSASHLRCAVRAARGARFHLDSLDLFAARARQQLAKASAELFGVAETVTSEDIVRLVEYAEQWQPGEATSAPTITISDSEREEAMKVLGAPDLLARIQRDLGAIGTIGEDDNRLLAYLAALSRKLEDPLSVLILSRSAAGKSHLADTITRLIPPEDLRRYTRVTGQALFYTDEQALSHKLVAIEEAAGAEDAAYSIRTLQSAGELRVAVTTKDPRDGRLRTDEYSVQGPVAFLVSSTSSAIDPETQSRFLVLSVDESQQATSRILEAQRQGETIEGLRLRRQADAIAKRHHVMQRLLEPVAVVNPFAPKLRFPAHTLRARRDQKKYLALIQAVTLLHQHGRTRKTVEVDAERVSYIEADLQDVLAANRLARAAFSRTLDHLSPQGRNLVAEIRALCEEQAQGEVLPDYTFRRRDLRVRSGWSETQLRQYLGELEQHDIVDAAAGRQGKEYVYHLAFDEEGHSLDLNLVTEEELSR